MRETFHATRTHRLQRALYIEPRRREQRLRRVFWSSQTAQGRRTKRPHPAPRGAPANSRWNARRMTPRQSAHRPPPCLWPSARIAWRSTGCPNRKSGEIEIAFGIKPRHLRRFTTDERAARVLARARDAFDYHGPRHPRSASRSRSSPERTAALRLAPRCRLRSWHIATTGSCPMPVKIPVSMAILSFVPTPSVPATRTGSLKPAAFRSNNPPKPPRSASAPGRRVAFAAGAMRSTSASPASISTPASL